MQYILIIPQFLLGLPHQPNSTPFLSIESEQTDKQKNRLRPGLVVHTFNSEVGRQRQEDL